MVDDAWPPLTDAQQTDAGVLRAWGIFSRNSRDSFTRESDPARDILVELGVSEASPVTGRVRTPEVVTT